MRNDLLNIFSAIESCESDEQPFLNLLDILEENLASKKTQSNDQISLSNTEEKLIGDFLRKVILSDKYTKYSKVSSIGLLALLKTKFTHDTYLEFLDSPLDQELHRESIEQALLRLDESLYWSGVFENLESNESERGKIRKTVSKYRECGKDETLEAVQSIIGKLDEDFAE